MGHVYPVVRRLMADALRRTNVRVHCGTVRCHVNRKDMPEIHGGINGKGTVCFNNLLGICGDGNS